MEARQRWSSAALGFGTEDRERALHKSLKNNGLFISRMFRTFRYTAGGDCGRVTCSLDTIHKWSEGSSSKTSTEISLSKPRVYI